MYLDGTFAVEDLISMDSSFPSNLFLLSSLDELNNFIKSSKNIAVVGHKPNRDLIGRFMVAAETCDIKCCRKNAADIYEGLSELQQLLIRPYMRIFEQMEKAFPRGRPRLTIKIVNDQMCPLFHEDNIHIRFITTLTGPGTQWLADEDVLRKNLGKGGNKAIIKPDSILRQLASSDIAIMKGRKAKGRKGLVHRSPPIDPKDGIYRLIIRYDLM